MTGKTSSQHWTEKHRPQTWKELQGNNKAIKHIKNWVTNWEEGAQPQLLVGDPGTGKTTTAWVAANELDIPMTQVNASSARKTEDLRELASEILGSPVTHDYHLVLVDEVDGLHHSVNKQVLYDALAASPNPVILTGNDDYKIPDGIKNKCKLHKFTLSEASRKAKLKKIIKAEGIDVDDHDLNKLAQRPDLRSAINDLQILSMSDMPMGNDDREWEEGAFDAIPRILGGEKWAGDMNPEELVIWLDQAVAKNYRGLEAGVAYDCLARADKWLGRTQQTRDYRNWKWAGELARMTSEVRLTEQYSSYIPDLFPTWFRHKQLNAQSDQAVSRVYRKMKNYDGGPYTFSGGFLNFKNVILPLLLQLPEEERRELALQNRLEDDELEVLDLDAKEFENWQGGQDASVQPWEEQGKSVLDF